MSNIQKNNSIMKTLSVAALIALTLTGCNHSHYEHQEQPTPIVPDVKPTPPEPVKSAIIDTISCNQDGSDSLILDSVVKLEGMTMSDVTLAYKSVKDSNLNGIFGDSGDEVVLGNKLKKDTEQTPISVTLTVYNKSTGDKEDQKRIVVNGN